MKVSVLVAVYNAEKYLHQCLDSLIGQTHQDLEIICVDDASTDGSWRILQEYARRDSRVIIMQHDENKGHAHARNTGLEVATGDYITMLDSDDWYSEDAVELLCREAEHGADCVLFDVMYYDDSSGREWRYEYRTDLHEFTGSEAFGYSLDWSIHGLYMVRSGIHQAYPYDTTLKSYSDDNVTTRYHYLFSKSVRRSNALYYYRQHSNSVSHKLDSSQTNLLIANYMVRQTLVEGDFPMALLALYEKQRWLNLIGIHVLYYENKGLFSDEERKKFEDCFLWIHKSIDTSLLPASLKCKFGYMPFKGCYGLYRMQVFLYTYFRRWFYRLKNSIQFRK